jgi:phosphatidylinositol kinase/protein kinase (PI-3  family)
LINALLANDPATTKSDLGIRRYSVMPLSNNSGVIGWVPNCDTLQGLIKAYRESRNIPLDLEKVATTTTHHHLSPSPPVARPPTALSVAGSSSSCHLFYHTCVVVHELAACLLGDTCLPQRLIWGLQVRDDDGQATADRVDYDKLDMLTKAEVFGEAMAKTQGLDIARMLWLRSHSAEVETGRAEG